MWSALLILAGLAGLLVGAELLVRGATALASRLGIRPIVIGLTVVSLGTSLPELAIGIDAARQGSPGLAVGNSSRVGATTIPGCGQLPRPGLLAVLTRRSPGAYDDADHVSTGQLPRPSRCSARSTRRTALSGMGNAHPDGGHWPRPTCGVGRPGASAATATPQHPPETICGPGPGVGGGPAAERPRGRAGQRLIVNRFRRSTRRTIPGVGSPLAVGEDR
jgi:hypothetical protein